MDGDTSDKQAEHKTPWIFRESCFVAVVQTTNKHRCPVNKIPVQDRLHIEANYSLTTIRSTHHNSGAAF